METNEIWKDILDYNDYQVSNFGRVKSLKFRKEKILKQQKRGDYFYIRLNKNGKRKDKYTHILVFETYNNYKLKNDECIHHVDKIKENNNYENLKLMPKSEHRSFHNIGNHHSEKIKRKISESEKGKIISEETRKKLCKNHADLKGENNHNHKLTEEQVVQIKILLEEGILTQQEIANMFGVNRATISYIKNNKIWSYIKI